jgi:hypothetical protein
LSKFRRETLMRRKALIVLPSFGLVVLLGMARQSEPKQTRCSGIAENALKNWQNLKVGMTRQDVERKFILDGGMQFPESSTYVVPNCEYVKVRVQFELSNQDAHLLAPQDTVSRISQLFVAYPARD